MKDQIEFSEFLSMEKKLDIRMGLIVAVSPVPKSSKLLELLVDFGAEKRTVVTNIGDKIEDQFSLIGVILPFIMNLKPVTMMGIESTAMIMLGESSDGKIEFNNFTLGSKLL